MGVMVTGLVACSSPGLKPWHTAELNEEFTAAMLEDGRVPPERQAGGRRQRAQRRVFGEEHGQHLSPPGPQGLEERSLRRWREMEERGKEANYQVVLRSMRRRDQIDSSREDSPLRAAPDAVLLDTTDLSVDEVVAEAERLVEEQGCP